MLARCHRKRPLSYIPGSKFDVQSDCLRVVPLAGNAGQGFCRRVFVYAEVPFAFSGMCGRKVAVRFDMLVVPGLARGALFGRNHLASTVAVMPSTGHPHLQPCRHQCHLQANLRQIHLDPQIKEHLHVPVAHQMHLETPWLHHTVRSLR